MRFTLPAFTFIILAGCGYSLQGTYSPLLEKEGVSKIYIEKIKNLTFKPGIEDVVYNALIKKLVSQGRVKLVREKEQADAILSGEITYADYTPATQRAYSFAPAYRKPEDPPLYILVASTYTANLACSFSLKRNPALLTILNNNADQNKPQKAALIWSSTFTRTTQFQANNQMGIPGTTAALINESEFDRAIANLAESMMGDLHESMLAMF